MGVMRLLFAISVLLIHVGKLPITYTTFVGGVVPVQCFFMISGFYMALILNERYSNIKDFYFNRLLRIFPTYWLILLLTTLTAIVLGNQIFITKILSTDWSWGSKLFMIFSNLFIFGSDIMMFFYPGADGMTFTKYYYRESVQFADWHVISQAWSLPIELIFYALAPFIVKSKKKLVAIAILSLLFRGITYHYTGDFEPWPNRFVPLEMFFFCTGALAYFIYKKIEHSESAAGWGLIVFTVMVIYITNWPRVQFIIPDTYLFIGQWMQFYICFFFALPFIFQATKNNRADRWIGELSYPVYLIHYLINHNIDILPAFFETKLYNVILYCILFSAIINHFFHDALERKFKKKDLPNSRPEMTEKKENRTQKSIGRAKEVST